MKRLYAARGGKMVMGAGREVLGTITSMSVVLQKATLIPLPKLLAMIGARDGGYGQGQNDLYQGWCGSLSIGNIVNMYANLVDPDDESDGDLWCTLSQFAFLHAFHEFVVQEGLLLKPVKSALLYFEKRGPLRHETTESIKLLLKQYKLEMHSMDNCAVDHDLHNNDLDEENEGNGGYDYPQAPPNSPKVGLNVFAAYGYQLQHDNIQPIAGTVNIGVVGEQGDDQEEIAEEPSRDEVYFADDKSAIVIIKQEEEC